MTDWLIILTVLIAAIVLIGCSSIFYRINRREEEKTLEGRIKWAMDDFRQYLTEEEIPTEILVGFFNGFSEINPLPNDLENIDYWLKQAQNLLDDKILTPEELKDFIDSH